MTIETFFTAQNHLTQGNGSGTPGLPSAASLNIQGLDFFDIILTNFISSENESGHSSETIALQSDNPALALDPSLDPATLLADTPELAEEADAHAETLSLGTSDEIETTLALNQIAFDKIMSGETADLEDIAAEMDIDINDLPDGVIIVDLMDVSSMDRPTIDETLLLTSSKDNTSGQGLSFSETQLSNLTPEQIAELIENAENGSSDASGDFGISVVQILPLQEKQSVIITREALIITSGPMSGEQINQLTPANDVTSKLTALLVSKAEAPERFASADIVDGEPLPAPTETDGFEHILKQLSTKPNTSSPKEGFLQSNTPGATPNLGVLQGWPFTMSGSLFSASNWALGTNEYGLQTASAMINNSTQFTNLVTQAQSAGQAHPGTQMVAATIQKNVANAENRNITLHLDPPELGRVEVRLEFASDKKLKTTVISEKPETHLMLQRDAQILERALQETGLDGDGNSLSFEMASDDHQFNHDGSHDGQGPMGQSPDGEETEELIETTMTWNVNPETGHTSYNILV